MKVGAAGDNPIGGQKTKKTKVDLKVIKDRVHILGKQIGEYQSQIDEFGKKQSGLRKETDNLRGEKKEIIQKRSKMAKWENIACKVGMGSTVAMIISASIGTSLSLAFLPVALGSFLTVGGSLYAVKKLRDKLRGLKSQSKQKQYKMDNTQRNIKNLESDKKEIEEKNIKAQVEYQQLKTEEEDILKQELEKMAKAATDGTTGEEWQISVKDKWVEIGGVKVKKGKTKK